MHSEIRSVFLLLLLSLFTGCTSAKFVNQSEDVSYESAYALDDRKLGPYDLDAVSTAPQRKVVMVHFKKPVSEVFFPLLTEVDRYDETIVDVSFDHSRSSNPGTFGVGSVRICTFDSGKVLYEPLVVFENNKFYAYSVDTDRSTRSLPIRDVVLFYSFEDRPQNSTLLTVRAHFNPPNPIVSPLINLAFGRALTNTFQAASDVFDGVLVRAEN